MPSKPRVPLKKKLKLFKSVFFHTSGSFFDKLSTYKGHVASEEQHLRLNVQKKELEEKKPIKGGSHDLKDFEKSREKSIRARVALENRAIYLEDKKRYKKDLSRAKKEFETANFDFLKARSDMLLSNEELKKKYFGKTKLMTVGEFSSFRKNIAERAEHAKTSLEKKKKSLDFLVYSVEKPEMLREIALEHERFFPEAVKSESIKSVEKKVSILEKNLARQKKDSLKIQRKMLEVQKREERRLKYSKSVKEKNLARKTIKHWSDLFYETVEEERNVSKKLEEAKKFLTYLENKKAA